MSADAQTETGAASARYLTAKVKAPCLGDSPHKASLSALPALVSALALLYNTFHKDVIQPCIYINFPKKCS
jgi:hypothetical protein